MVRYANMLDFHEILDLVYQVQTEMINRDLHIWEYNYPALEDILFDIAYSHALVNIQDGKIAGYLAIFINDPFDNNVKFTINDDYIFISRVMVNPLFRGQGIAKDLFKYVFDLNKTGYRISVSPINKNAIALYEKIGFKYIDKYHFDFGDVNLLEKVNK